MKIEERLAKAEERLSDAFENARRVERSTFRRVMDSFLTERISPRHFAGTTGYGYGDEGRDAFERVFARAMGAEMALVRPGIASGTHALTVTLFGLLRPGQTLLYASGAPYDTLHGVIGIGRKAEYGDSGSLRDFGIGYRQAELLPDGSPDIEEIKTILKEEPSIGLVAVQRSRGYSWRKSLSLAQIGDIAGAVREVSPQLPIMVDNCYGEFVRETEPVAHGADVIVGSLIKNPGGGLAPTGGYIAGKAKYVGRCASRLTAPGVGAEIGSWAGGYLPYYQGLYMAPHTVAQARMGALLAAEAFSEAGFAVSPEPGAPCEDIICAIRLNSRENVIAFCRAIQAASPVDGHVTPEPWAMPGYDDEVIMAAGTFVGGASIELSADAPMRPPYAVYMQGGLTYEHCRYAVGEALKAVLIH